MSTKPRPAAIKEETRPDTALANYLDTLLAEIDLQPQIPTEQDVKDPIPQADTILEAKTLETRLETVEDRADSTGTGSIAAVAPSWAETPFQLLRFEVNGVNMVVPLMSLTGIIPLNGTLSHLPGQPAWSLGVMMNRDTKVVVVDTRRLLMPDGKLDAPSCSHLLLFGDGLRGLAVDAIGDTVMLEKEAIRWRGGVENQPWYGGILIEELSVLLDIEGVQGMLAA
jgi:purine-binding chemotaxis protein CheW